jgi:hypothetical protein
MKSVVTGIILTVVISAIAWAVWQTQTTTSADRFTSTENVRLN